MPTANHTLTNKLFDRFWRLAGAVSVRTKILGIVLGLVLLLGLGTMLQVRQVSQRALLDQLQEQSVALGRDMAARVTDLILINDLYNLHQLLIEMRANNANVSYAFIVDQQGEILVHTFAGGFPPGLLAANSAAAGDHHHTVVLATDEGRVWDTAVPIFDGQAGTARIGLTEQGVQATVTLLTWQMVLTILIVSSVGIAAAILLTWIVTRPILDLKEAAQAVGQGDFSQRPRPWADDEIGELAVAFNAMTTGLAQAEKERAEREQLRLQLLEKVISAQEEERQRIARELHDETGQALTALLVRLKTLDQLCVQPALQQQVGELRQLVGQALDNVRNLARELRPSVLDDLGLAAALERYVQDYQSHHPIQVDLMMLGLAEERLTPAVETALYRIVQESLTNVARHAQAQTASVLLERRGDRVRAIIEDDGLGFDPRQAGNGDHLGLYGMRERAELLQGKMTIESEPNQGTSVFVEVPL